MDTRVRALRILEDLVAFDSESHKSNLPLVDYLKALMSDFGVPFVVAPNAGGDKAALLAMIGPFVDGGVLLSGHTDVVPVTGQSWSSDPFKLRAFEGRLYGRGACDMKGFVAVALACIPEFQRAELARPIHIALSYDEETTCAGSLDLIAQFGRDLPRPALAIIGEPTAMALVDAHKSIATFCTRVSGFEAHSAKPRLGANAVSAGAEIIAEIDRLSRECEAQETHDLRFDPPHSTYHVGMVTGGSARNIAAGSCEFFWEFRGLPGVSPMAATTRVQNYVDRVALPRLRRFRAEPTIETTVEVDVPGLAPEPDSSARTAMQRLARTNSAGAVSFATEAGQFQKAGVPAFVCGPGSIDQAHKPDEFIETAEIDAAIAFMRRLVGDEMVAK